METDKVDTLERLLTLCSSVSVKGVENGVYRAWGVGIGEYSGKVVYADGGTPKRAIDGLLLSVARGDWRVDRFSRAF